MRARNIQLKLRYSDFTTISRQVTVESLIDGDEAIFRHARRLLDLALEERSSPVRLLGVGVADFGTAVRAAAGPLPGAEGTQLALSMGEGPSGQPPNDERPAGRERAMAPDASAADSRVSSAVDTIRRKYGAESIKRGVTAPLRRPPPPFTPPDGDGST
jgi:hypothetical protein